MKKFVRCDAGLRFDEHYMLVNEYHHPMRCGPMCNATGDIYDFWNAQALWSNATFGDEQYRGPVGPLKHAAKEIQEAIRAVDTPEFLEEMGDCFAIILDAARRGGLTLDQLIEQAITKLVTVNMRREWPETDPSEPVEHVRSAK